VSLCNTLRTVRGLKRSHIKTSSF